MDSSGAIWYVALLAGIMLSGCNTTPVQDGAVVGGALGAGLGAIIGHQSGNQGEGALIGAGVGALTGAIVGDQVARSQKAQAAQTPPPPSQPPVRVRQVGRYETRVVRSPSGELYEERVWLPGG